jgi:TfoX/Sxy family transcriptional regulator of competence genes
MDNERSKEEHDSIMEQIAGVLRDVLAALEPGTELTTRKMFGGMGYYVEGRMFGGYYGSGLALKLPDAEREALQAQGGIPQEMSKSSTEVPSAYLEDTTLLSPWVAKSLKHVRALPDKKRKQ